MSDGPSNSPSATASKTSGLAIAALILSIAGPCTCIVGLVLGIVALKKIGRSQGALGGRGLAVAAIVVAAAWILILIVLSLLVMCLVLFRSEVQDWTHDTWEKARQDAGQDFIEPGRKPGSRSGLARPSLALPIAAPSLAWLRPAA